VHRNQHPRPIDGRLAVRETSWQVPRGLPAHRCVQARGFRLRFQRSVGGAVPDGCGEEAETYGCAEATVQTERPVPSSPFPEAEGAGLRCLRAPWWSSEPEQLPGVELGEASHQIPLAKEHPGSQGGTHLAQRSTPKILALSGSPEQEDWFNLRNERSSWPRPCSNGQPECYCLQLPFLCSQRIPELVVFLHSFEVSYSLSYSEHRISYESAVGGFIGNRNTVL